MSKFNMRILDSRRELLQSSDGPWDTVSLLWKSFTTSQLSRPLPSRLSGFRIVRFPNSNSHFP